MKSYLTIYCLIISCSLLAQGAAKYYTENGTVAFSSEASLEIIKATSNKLVGTIDPVKNTFTFNLEIISFDGFNSPMQKVHFNENYMETERFQAASFSGRIIEKVDLNKPGVYSLRAKGKLNVHGVKQERIIKCTVKVEEGKIRAQTKFSILLDEHGIQLPKIIKQKIAEEVIVQVDAELEKQQM